MTHKLISLIIATLLTTSYVAASGLTVSGVYYDPVQAENGGEAIQLENSGDTPLALDSVTLFTKQSTFSLPATLLLPGQGFLIGDSGWSGQAGLRDNLSWPDADQEVSLNLANTDGFVELQLMDGTVLDRLAWNSSNGSKAREAYMWTPGGEAVPAFRNSKSIQVDVPATLTVTDVSPVLMNATWTDDAPNTVGVQLLSFARVVALSVDIEEPNTGLVNASISWFGTSYLLNATTNNSGTLNSYAVQLPFTPQTPGDYTATLTVTDGNNTVTYPQIITVLSSTSITTSGSLVFSGGPGETVNGSFTITNEGNVGKTVTVQHTIPAAQCDTTTVVLAPDESRDVHCTITVPNTTSGTYNYKVHLVAS